ncbi:MAG: beta-aspartyl-peptidase, partial [Woeseiaceae bacterium]|nr:beta-aspartyl-peptidase [Woeseiaceae bacterium]
MLEVLTNARVFAPEDLGICQLLVGGGQFLAVSQGSETIAAPNARVTDLGGRRLIPGFIDGHAHVTGGGGESGFSSRVPPVPLSGFT